MLFFALIGRGIVLAPLKSNGTFVASHGLDHQDDIKQLLSFIDVDTAGGFSDRDEVVWFSAGTFAQHLRRTKNRRGNILV